jgi:hypothetical protein
VANLPTFGTGFAQAGFTYDQNLSPNNQAFSAAVVAIVSRLGVYPPVGGGSVSAVTFADDSSTPIYLTAGGGGPTSGTIALTFTLSTEAANTIFAGPASGGNAQPAFRALVAADIPSSILPGGFAGFANPAHKVSGTATNGTSTFAMRADATPALDETLTPTWLGVHTFSGTTGAQAVLGTSTGYAWGTGTNYPILQFAGIGALFGTATAGLTIAGGGLYYNGTNYIYGQAGTGILSSWQNGTFAVSCFSTAGTAGGTGTPTAVFSISGTVTSNKVQAYGPVAAALVDMTPDASTFQGTLLLGTAGTAGTCVWSRMGNHIFLFVPGLAGTSTSTTLTLAPLPTQIQPTRTQWAACPSNGFINAGAITTGQVGALVTASNGTLNFNYGTAGGGWSATGVKGLNEGVTIGWLLN